MVASRLLPAREFLSSNTRLRIEYSVQLIHVYTQYLKNAGLVRENRPRSVYCAIIHNHSMLQDTRQKEEYQPEVEV